MSFERCAHLLITIYFYIKYASLFIQFEIMLEVSALFFFFTLKLCAFLKRKKSGILFTVGI